MEIIRGEDIQESVHVGKLEYGACMLFDGELCILMEDNLNLRPSFPGSMQIPVFSLHKNKVYMLSITDKVLPVSVDPITYRYK